VKNVGVDALRGRAAAIAAASVSSPVTMATHRTRPDANLHPTHARSIRCLRVNGEHRKEKSLFKTIGESDRAALVATGLPPPRQRGRGSIGELAARGRPDLIHLFGGNRRGTFSFTVRGDPLQSRVAVPLNQTRLVQKQCSPDGKQDSDECLCRNSNSAVPSDFAALQLSVAAGGSLCETHTILSSVAAGVTALLARRRFRR